MNGGLIVSYVIVFLASACTLVLEIVAGRILAPFIGVSLYTWTSIIGVVLAGISVGNYLGGVVADRIGSRRTLGLILLAGGLTSLLILPLAATDLTQLLPRTAAGVNQTAWLMFRIVVLTCLLFLPPALILGMVSPVVIKLALTDLKHTGNVVGKIYAFSTLGSIVGTFATGFFLISYFGTRMIVLGVGLVLIAMALVFGDFLRPRRENALTLAGAALLVASLLYVIYTRDAWASPCYKETDYYCIKVTDHSVGDRTVKTLVLDHLIHSYNSIEDPTYLVYGYIKVDAEISEYVAQRTPDYKAFFIGGGAYTLPRYMETRHPRAQIEVTEIDPGVTATNFEMMGVDPNTRIITYNTDAREIIERKQGTGEQYDLVYGDAFNDLQIPYHLTTREFAQKVRNLLKDDGIYAALVIDKLRGGQFIPAYVTTVKSVFPHVYILSDGTPWNSSFANTYIVAASATPIDFERLKTIRGQGVNGQSVINVFPPDQMQEWLQSTPTVLLTDDYAPADNLVAPLFAERGF